MLLSAAYGDVAGKVCGVVCCVRGGLDGDTVAGRRCLLHHSRLHVSTHVQHSHVVQVLLQPGGADDRIRGRKRQRARRRGPAAAAAAAGVAARQLLCGSPGCMLCSRPCMQHGLWGLLLRCRCGVLLLLLCCCCCCCRGELHNSSSPTLAREKQLYVLLWCDGLRRRRQIGLIRPRDVCTPQRRAATNSC